MAACEQAPPERVEESPLAAAPTSGPTSAPTAAPTPAPLAVTPDTGGGDVWAWQRTITGTLANGGPDTAVTFLVNGAAVEAEREGERFTLQAPIATGPNEVTLSYQAADGTATTLPIATYTGRLSARPSARLTLALENNSIIADSSASAPDEASASPIGERTWSERAGNPAPLGIDPSGGERLAITPPTADGEYYLSVQVVDAEGRADTSTNYFVVENGQPRIPDYAKENTAWVENAVVYGVIPRKFGDPGFPAVTERLDYLRDLGITALWFSPINRSPRGDFGYAVVDYFDVNPDLGTLDDFKALVAAAHERGIRVMIDFVPNHSSAEHPYYLDTLANGEKSAYYEFYDRDENGQPTHYFDWEHLPNLNFDNPEVERFMTEAFSFWVRDMDVDGFRVDVAWGVKERKPDYWPRWRDELKRIKPDLLLLAEASARDPYYFDNGFDVAYDWTSQLGKWAWELVWDAKTLLTYNLNTALTNNNQGFHPDALIFRFLNNNDTGTRFVTTHGEEMTRVAAALLLTLPGVPCVYTGDEIGAWYRPYNDALPLSWEEKYQGLRDYYTRLIALRKDTPALHSRDWQLLEAEPHQHVYAYLRYTKAVEASQPQSPALILLNFSDEAAEAIVPLPEAFAGLGQAGTLRDILANESVAVQGGASLTMPLAAWGVRILQSDV